jgi:hypothetical protein
MSFATSTKRMTANVCQQLCPSFRILCSEREPKLDIVGGQPVSFVTSIQGITGNVCQLLCSSFRVVYFHCEACLFV